MAERASHKEDEHRLEWVDPERRFDRPSESSETFDRFAYASKLLRLLQPKNVTVILHDSHHGVRLERGRDYSRGRGATWAMLGLSAHASREWIALAVAELAGLERTPFIVDLLLNADGLANGADALGATLAQAQRVSR